MFRRRYWRERAFRRRGSGARAAVHLVTGRPSFPPPGHPIIHALRENRQRRDDFRRAFLLDPMAGAVDEVEIVEAGAGGAHTLQRAGALVHPPIAASGDEAGRDFDDTTREQAQIACVAAARSAAIPLQPALEAGALILPRINRKRRVGQPAAGGDLGGPQASRRPPFQPSSVAVHDVIGGHLREFARRPSRKREGPVRLPVGALVVKIGAQEVMHALAAADHVAIGRARRVIPLVMFARALQRRQIVVNGVGGAAGGERRRSRERRAHHRQRAEQVRADQRAARRDVGPRVMSEHAVDAAPAERPPPVPRRRARDW